MIQINPLKSYIDGGVRAALTTPPSASLVFDLPGKAIWVKGVKLKGTDHTYTFSHDNYITLTNTPDSNESEDIKIGVNTSALKSAIDTTYGVVSTTANGLAPKFTSGNKLAASAATTYYFLGWTGSTLKWYQAPFRNIRINSETTDRLGVNSTDPLIISSGNGISVTWDSTNKKIVITNTKPDVNHNTDRTGIKLATVSGTKKTDSTLILANSTTGLNIQGGTNKFLIGDGTNYIEVPVVPSVSNKDATIGTALTTIATVAGVDIKAKIASYSLSNHTHSVKINGSTKTIAASGAVDLGNYLPLSGGTMGGTAWIKWPDSGNISNNNEGITFPVIRGGLEWRGQTDYIKLFSEETGRDNLNLVLQFGDDNSNGLSIRNASNVQTSYISAGGVITTGTFKGNLDWSYITNKPSSYTPSAHTHAWNSLTHSSNTENQAILTNGGANGWKLYTLNISGWNNAANNAHSHSNKSVLDGITSTLVSNWNTAYSFVNTISGTDTDKVINKWDEIVNFLAGISEDDKLNTLLNSKLSVYKLADNTNVGAIKNNGIYYSTFDDSSSTLVNSPFSNSFTLINITSHDNGDDLRRSRLAFNAYGEVKVSNDRGLANTAETWYNILTSKNTYVSENKGYINGTQITYVNNASSATNATNARKLVNWYSTRPTSLNVQFGDGSLRIFHATASTTEGKSPNDATILHLSWDNNGGWDTQLGISPPSGRVYSRAQNKGTWQSWKTLAFTTDIPTSLKNPYALTISLNGTSQGPYDGSAAKNINITPSSIGAATSGHNHDSSYVKYTKVTKSTADNANATPYLYNVENEEVISGYHKYWYIFNMGQYSGGNFGTLIAMPYQDKLTDSELFIRSAKSGSWRTWRRVLHSNNYAAILDSRYYTESESDSRFVNITGDTMTGPLQLNGSPSQNNPPLQINYTSNFEPSDLTIGLLKFGKLTTHDMYLGISPTTRTHFGRVGYFMHVNSGCEFTWASSGWTNLMALAGGTGNLWVKGSITAGGFIKSGSSNSYILLGAGGHKAISDFATSGHNHNNSYVASVSISGNNLRINKNGVNTDLIIPYAINADKVDGYHEYNFSHSWRANAYLYTKFITITRSSEKGFIRLHCAVEDNSGIKGADYIVHWLYDGSNENKSITINCLSSYGSNADTSVYAVRKSGTLFDLIFKALSTGAFYVGFSVISYSSSCTIDNYSIVGYTEETKPQAVYTSSAMSLITDIIGNASTATTASKLGTSTVGATNVPIYLNSGTPTVVNLNSTANNLINNLFVGDSIPADNDYYISQYVNGGTTNTTYYRRSHLLLYKYIKGKAEGTWNISITGNANTVDNIHATGFLRWKGMLNIGSNAPFQAVVDIMKDTSKLNDGGLAFYSYAGDEYTVLIGSRNDTTRYGNALKWGYANKYLWMIRMINGSPRSSDWEKISAGYADSAGNADTLDGYHANAFATAEHNHFDRLSSVNIDTGLSHTLNRHYEVNNATGTLPFSSKWHQVYVMGGDDSGYTTQICTGLTVNTSLYFRHRINTTWNSWRTILDSDNSSVSGGGSTWGSSITVNINGTSKTLTIPGNPNTDYRVTQSETTTTNYRPLVIGYTNVSTAGSGMTGSVTNQVYLSNKFYVQPSTGNLYATNFVGTLSGNASSATKLQTARTIWGLSFNGTANIDNTLRIKQTTNNYCEGIRIQNGDNTWATIILGATADSGTNTNAWSIHRKADNNFAISRNSSDGINGLVMTSVGMGLGTTAPAYRLDVNGQIHSSFASNNGNPCIMVNPTNDTDWCYGIEVLATKLTAGHRTGAYWAGKKNSTNNAICMSYYHAGDGSVDNRLIWHTWGSGDKMMLTANGRVGIGVTPSYKLHVDGDIYTTTGFKKNGSSDSYVLLGGGGHKAISDFMLKTDELSNNLTTISKSLTVTQAWMDTGIKYTDLPANGTYIIQVSANNTADGIWNNYWSGIMSWYIGDTNDSEADEIILHRAGHAYHHTIYLRTIMTASSDGRHLRLQIAADTNLSTAVTYTFKFKRVI